MRIEQLEYLTAVTRYGSLRRASEQLHLSQPALSEAIRSLERELGVDLLERRRSGARISAAGQELLPRVSEVLDVVAQLRDEAGAQRTGTRIVRVGTVNAATSALVVPGIRRFTEDHPTTTVDVASLLPEAVHRGLLEGGLDVGLVNVLPGDELPAQLQGVELLRGRTVVVCRSDDPLAASDTVALDALRARPFVAMREGYLMHRVTHRLFGGRLPHETCTADGAENGKFLVAAGVGVTVLPDYSVLGDPLEVAGVLAVRPLQEPTPTVTMLAVRRRGPRPAPSIVAFEQTLLELAGAHPQGAVA